MASLLDKVQTLIAANMHSLVDEALKKNSLAVIDQYIRQVEDNLEDLEDAAATIGGEVKTLHRKFDEFAAKAEELDRNIDLMLKRKANSTRRRGWRRRTRASTTGSKPSIRNCLTPS